MDKWKAGSFTVEAAFLVPLLIYLMVGVIYIDFWLFNQVTAQAVCCQAAWQMSTGDTEDMEQRLLKRLETALLSADILRAESNYNILYHSASCEIRIEIPFPGIQWVLGETSGYQCVYTSTVSHLADVTIFRKLMFLQEEETVQ